MFRPRRQQRYRRLIESGFLPFEARVFSRVPVAHAPFMRKMARDRRELVGHLRRDASVFNWSQTRYQKEKRQLVAYEYREKGLLYGKTKRGIIVIKGRPDPWQLFRYYRDKAVEDGEWGETPRRSYKRKKRFDEHGFRIDKGNIKAQKERRRERQKRKKELGY